MIIVLIRSVILYLLIIIGIRLLGKRQVGELEPSELVLSLIIADLAAVPMQDNGIPLLSGIIPIFTLLSVTTVLSILTMKSIRFRALICGRPSIIVANGKLRQREMRRNRFTVDELMEELRFQGIVDLSLVKYAVLETNGHLSVLLRESEHPVTAAQMGLAQVPDPGLPVILINDGRLIKHNLTGRGLDQNWLKKQLSAHHIKQYQDVFLLTIDENDQVYFVPKEI